MNNNLGLAVKSTEFSVVISGTTCTDAQGSTLDLEHGIVKVMEQLLHNKKHGGAVYIIGNGGSAAVASHAITDFMNVCRLRAFTLHESSLMTCMSNDFGYENAFSRLINTTFRPGDILIAISSSGNSANICNAAKMATEMGGIVITLTGFQPNNTLRKLGDINLWLNSCDYGVVEIGHLFILHNLSDRIGVEIKKQEKVADKI